MSTKINKSSDSKESNEAILSGWSDVIPYLWQKINNEWISLNFYVRKYSWFGRCRKYSNISCDNSPNDYINKGTKDSSENEENKYEDLIELIDCSYRRKSVVDLKKFESIMMTNNHGYINVNKNESGDSALMRAIKYEMVDLVEFLLKNKADIHVINNFNFNVLHLAAFNRETTIMKRLVEELGNDSKNKLKAKTKKQLQTPLHIAAKCGSKNVVEYLISQLKVDKEELDGNGRTALMLAAEYNKKDTVELLINLGCCLSFTEKTRNSESAREAIFDKNGYNALHWIVTKMPDIAESALNELHRPNLYLRKDDYYLTPLEPKLNGGSIPKSVLMSLVETENLDLLMHPVILCLINFKWKKFGRYSAWMEFLLTIVYITVWIAFALWKPYNTRYKYDNSPSEGFRFSLFIIGILCTGYYIAIEIAQIFMEYKFQKNINKCRENQLADERNNVPEDYNILFDYNKEETVMIKRNGVFKVFHNYLTDFWNYFDWLSILLLLACIISHVVDIYDHDELKARTHIRIMSVTIIIIPWRLLKVGRLIIPKFGTLVMILYYVVFDIIIWFLIFLVIWLPFTCAFWMIYGGVKFDKSVNENVACTDVDNKTYNEQNNCTTVSVDGFERYDLMAYSLYRLTFGNDLDETSMNMIDDTMTNLFIGAYIGFTGVVLINIFIALLSSSFSRVYEKAAAYVVFQRASDMVQSEIFMGMFQRSFHIKQIETYGNPIKNKKYEIDSSALQENLNKLDEKVCYLTNKIDNLEYNKRVKTIIINETEDIKKLLITILNNQNEHCEHCCKRHKQIDYLVISTK